MVICKPGRFPALRIQKVRRVESGYSVFITETARGKRKDEKTKFFDFK
jgi:hypothetical protein